MDNAAYEHDLRHYNNNTKDAEVGGNNWINRTNYRNYFISRQGKRFLWVKRKSRLKRELSTRMFFLSLLPSFFSLWLLSPCPSYNPQLMWWVYNWKIYLLLVLICKQVMISKFTKIKSWQIYFISSWFITGLLLSWHFLISSIQVNNLGTWANAAVYASLILSCMFMPSILIKMLKVKWTLVICIFCYSTYIAAQFYPEFYTLLPTAFILGMGAAPMWSAKCTYLTQVAHRFAGLDGSDPEPVVVKFFGIFFFFYQCNSILGNIISTSGSRVILLMSS